MKKLRIAILPHLGRPITRYTRAARSRVIYDLITELVKVGHEVFLLGTDDSRTPAKNIPVCPTGVFLLKTIANDFYRHNSYIVQALSKLIKIQDSFDIVHNHLYPEFLPYLIEKQLKIPLVTTIHTQMYDYLIDAFRQFPQSQLVALSNSHRRDAQGLKIPYVVYNGIDIETFPFNDKPKDYLLFIGRMKIIRKENGEIFDSKGVLTAIKVAKKLKTRLLISGSIETKQMFEEFIKPRLSDTIRFIGKVSSEAPLSREEVAKLYQGAKALLFPIRWDEPFGLVVVEANACGTPVIAFNRGAMPELIKNSVNGFVVETIQEMMEAVDKIEKIDRKVCHNFAKEHFSKELMAQSYEKIYYQLIH